MRVGGSGEQVWLGWSTERGGASGPQQVVLKSVVLKGKTCAAYDKPRLIAHHARFMMPSKVKCSYCNKPFYPERLKVRREQ